MKRPIPGSNAFIEEQLHDEARVRDRKWVTDRLEKAEEKLERIEYDWQSSGGYGSRSAITKLENEIQLCRLALSGLEQGCHRCEIRLRNINSFTKTLKAEKEAGCETVAIDRAVDLINALI